MNIFDTLIGLPIKSKLAPGLISYSDVSSSAKKLVHGFAGALGSVSANQLGLDNVSTGLQDSSSALVSSAVSGLGFNGLGLSSSAQQVSSASPAASSAVPTGGGTAAVVDPYLNAELARVYGMDATTAYQEALANTSYQRAVADLKAAGLNPVLAVSGLQGAGGVYSPQVAGSGVSLSSGVSSAHQAYKYYSNLGSLLGTGIGFITHGVSGAYIGGTVGSRLLGAVGNLIDSQ